MNSLGRHQNINSLNYLKLICAYLVVAIHTCPFSEINETLGFIATQVVPRVAVPLFFAISGYFYIKTLQSGKKPFARYMKRLIVTYIAWSAVYFPITFYNRVFVNGATIKSFVINYAMDFFWYGLHFHFWYFPALIICIIITTAFYKMNQLKLLYVGSLFLYVIGVIGCAYNKIGLMIPGLSVLYSSGMFESIRRVFMMGLPFFMIGFIADKPFKKEKKQYLIPAVITCIALFLFEIALVVKVKIQNGVVITFAMYPLVLCIFRLCLEHPMRDRVKYSNDCRKLSGFIYYVHPLAVILLKNFLEGYPTAVFLLACLLSTLLGLIVVKINNKTLNKILL